MSRNKMTLDEFTGRAGLCLKMKTTHHYALLLAGFVAASLLTAPTFANCDVEEFPVMDEMHISVLAPAMNFNGLNMSIREFTIDDDVESVREFYNQKWKGELVENLLGDTLQIAHHTDDCSMLVQIMMASEGSAGRLVINNPELNMAAQSVSVPLPEDATIAYDMRDNDGGKNAVTLLATSFLSRSEVETFYKQELKRKRWVYERSMSGRSGTASLYRKGRDEFNLVIMTTEDQRQTQILINRVEQ